MNSIPKTPPRAAFWSGLPRLKPTLIPLALAALLLGCGPKPQPKESEPAPEKPPTPFETKADFGQRGSVELLGFIVASAEGPRGTDEHGKYLDGIGGDPRMMQAINTALQMNDMPPVIAVFAVSEKDSTIKIEGDRMLDADWFSGSLVLHLIRQKQLPKELAYTVTANWTDNADPLARFRISGDTLEPLINGSPCEARLETMSGNLKQVVAECSYESAKPADSLTLALVAPYGDRSDGTTVPGSQIVEGRPVQLILPLSANAIGEAVVVKSQVQEIKLIIPAPQFTQE